MSRPNERPMKERREKLYQDFFGEGGKEKEDSRPSRLQQVSTGGGRRSRKEEEEGRGKCSFPRRDRADGGGERKGKEATEPVKRTPFPSFARS